MIHAGQDKEIREGPEKEVTLKLRPEGAAGQVRTQVGKSVPGGGKSKGKALGKNLLDENRKKPEGLRQRAWGG